MRHAQLYGDPGQAQLGLDIVAVAADDSGVALQSKRVKQFGPAEISAVVEAFRKTTRPFGVSRFILGVSREVRTTAAIDRFKELQKELAPIQFELWDQRELSHKLKRAPEIIIDYFGKDMLAAHLRPGQTVDLADLVVLLGDAEGIAAHAQEGVEVLGRDGDALERLVQQQRLDGLAADLGQLAFQRAHAGLPRVETQDVAQHRFAHRQLTGLEAVVPDLLGQQVALGNRDLLVLGF